MKLLLAAGIPLALYLMFLVIPSVVCFFMTFGRKTVRDFAEQDLTGTAYALYGDEIRAAAACFRARPLQPVSITAADGTVLKGYYLVGGKTTVLMSHGYCSSPMNNFAPQAEHLAKAGYSLLLIVQRGHNESGGRYTTLGLKEREDIRLWADWALAQPGTKTLFLYGISMGCAAVAYASETMTDPRVGGMILDCGFSSPWEQMAADCRKRHLPAELVLPWVRLCGKLFLGRDIRDSVKTALEKTTLPALFFHGTKDNNVPWEQGLANFEACASEKELFRADGAGHAVSYFAGGAAAQDTLDRFLERHTA